MAIDIKLESYLAALDKALSPISVSERAEILTEIKSHILSSQERTPKASMDEILNGFGPPDAVAAKYLNERGFAKPKSSSGHWFKWAVIGILGMFAIFFIFIAFLIWKFSPLITMDEDKAQVKILGGLINLDGEDGKFLIGSTPFSGSFQLGERWSGSEKIRSADSDKKNSDKNFVFDFANGSLLLRKSAGEEITWNCKSSGGPAPSIERSNGEVRLSAANIPNLRCEILVPANLPVRFRGINGKVRLHDFSAPVDGQLTNGTISFYPAIEASYTFDTKVDNGVLGPFPNSAGATAIRLKVGNGKIDYKDKSHADWTEDGEVWENE